MGRVVQVQLTHTWNDAFTIDVDEYVKKIFYSVRKNDLYDASLHESSQDFTGHSVW